MWRAAAATEEQIVRERIADARATALLVDLFISDNISALQVLGRPGTAALDDLDITRAAKALADAAALNTNWDGVGLLDSKGFNVLPSGSTPARSVSVADREYFREATRTGRPVVSDAVIGRFSGKPAVVIAVPATLASGDRGIITAILSLQFLEDVLHALPGATDTQVIVVDRAGRAIVHPDPAVVAALSDLSALTSVTAALAGENGAIQRVDDGTEFLAAYAPVLVPKWGVVVREPTSSAFALIRAEVTQAAALLSVGTVVALTLAWFLGGVLERYSSRALEAERQLAREKDELLNTLGHELKTPLTSLSLAAQALGRSSAGPASDERMRRNVAIIRDQVARASALLAELLESARLDQVPLRRERVDLGALTRAAVERQLAYLQEPAQHTITLTQEGSVVVEGDPSRLEQVIANLLTNAVKYSPNGGAVDARVERVDGRVRLVVADHGIGIAKDERESVFSPFARSRAAIERGIEGTGLGLYLSKRIVEAHGGTIGAADTAGGGTTIVVSLPPAVAPPETAALS
jgi:signal transduction histidine kinase